MERRVSGETGFTHGVLDNGSSLTVWFARSPKSDSVDIHFTVNGGGQQNVSMGYNGTRHEVNVPATSGAAVALAYSFTYMTGTGARDSASYTWNRGTTATVATPVISPAGGIYHGSHAW